MLQSPGVVSSNAADSARVVMKPVLQRAVSVFQPQLKLTPLATTVPSQFMEHRWIRHGSDVGDTVGADDVGCQVMCAVGSPVGAAVGLAVGLVVGTMVGFIVGLAVGSADDDVGVVGAVVQHFRGHPPRMLRSCSQRSHERQVCSIEQKVQSPHSRWT